MKHTDEHTRNFHYAFIYRLRAKANKDNRKIDNILNKFHAFYKLDYLSALFLYN
jgi:hypothetical protein